ncbi:MAG TPA: PDGLE domain-containing protein [Candidatus Brocadiaceae bacterium]
MKLPKKQGKVVFILFSLSLVVGLVFLIVPFTSKNPDGLEKVSQTMGFLKKDDFKPLLIAPMPGYSMSGIKNKIGSRWYASIIGVFIVFGITVFVGYMLKRKRDKM